MGSSVDHRKNIHKCKENTHGMLILSFCTMLWVLAAVYIKASGCAQGCSPVASRLHLGFCFMHAIYLSIWAGHCQKGCSVVMQIRRQQGASEARWGGRLVVSCYCSSWWDTKVLSHYLKTVCLLACLALWFLKKIICNNAHTFIRVHDSHGHGSNTGGSEHWIKFLDFMQIFSNSFIIGIDHWFNLLWFKG